VVLQAALQVFSSVYKADTEGWVGLSFHHGAGPQHCGRWLKPPTLCSAKAKIGQHSPNDHDKSDNINNAIHDVFFQNKLMRCYKANTLPEPGYYHCRKEPTLAVGLLPLTTPTTLLG